MDTRNFKRRTTSGNFKKDGITQEIQKMNQKLEKFHRYMNLYQQLVKVNAGRFVGEQLSEDVAQETFIKM